MALSDMAEAWWREPHMTYMGKEFKHNPNHKCSHYNPSSGNVDTTIYIGDINCYECIENLNSGTASNEGLKDGNAPETFYMSKREKKNFNAQKRFNEQHGKCSCGCNWQIRKNRNNGQEFLGCINYPTCKNTKSITRVSESVG